VTLTFNDVFGFAAFASNVAGNLMLTRKNAGGWHVRIVSILLWGAYGVQTASLPIIANAVTFLGINIYGLWNWRRMAAAEGR
jgi:hypothetical protein